MVWSGRESGVEETSLSVEFKLDDINDGVNNKAVSDQSRGRSNHGIESHMGYKIVNSV